MANLYEDITVEISVHNSSNHKVNDKLQSCVYILIIYSINSVDLRKISVFTISKTDLNKYFLARIFLFIYFIY